MSKPKLSSIPSRVQLPGGIVLKGHTFRVLEYNEDRTPKTFQLMPPGFVDRTTDVHNDWTIYAVDQIRAPVTAAAYHAFTGKLPDGASSGHAGE